MGFLSWLTGRDEKEQDVYANYERVDDLVTNLKKVSTDNVTTASDAVKAAVTELNNVNGMAQFVGQVSADCFTPTFERVASTIDQIGTMVQQKADNIKTYEESAWYEKLGSTFAMAGAKLGEGVLSVVEDLGDGVVSLVGWVAPKDSGVEQWCSEFVQKEWSHDAFNFYYESEFAKKSTFTEDSALAGGFKLVGTVAAYCFAGGAVSGAVGKGVGAVGKAASAGSKIAQTAVKAGNVVGKLGSLASSSTWAATAVAGIAGMGSGTENALLNGAESFDAAAWSGAKQGVGQAALAFAGGKLGEKVAKAGAVKAATQSADDAANSLNAAKTAAQSADDVLNTAKAAANTADDALKAAITNSTDDAVTAAQQAAANASDDVLKAALNSSDDVVKAAATSADDAAKALQTAIQSGDDAAIQAAQKVAAQTTDDLAQAIAGTTDDAVTAAQKIATQASDDLVNAIANTSDDALRAAATTADDAAKAVIQATQGVDDAANALTQATQQADEAAQALTSVKDAKLSSFQGYDDAMTRAGQKFGANPIATTKEALTTTVQTAGNAGKAVANAVTHPVQTVKTAATTVVNGVKAAPGAVVNAVKAAPGAVVTAAKTVGTAAIQNPGVVAQGVNAAINNSQAADNIAGFTQPQVDVMGPTGEEVVQDYVTPTGQEFTTEQQFKIDTGDGSTGGTTGDTGGGSTGGYTGGYTGGGSTGGTTGGTTGDGSTGGTTGDGSTGGTTGDGSTGGTTGDGSTGGYTGGYTGPTDGTTTGDETHTGSGFGGDDEFNGAAFEIDEGFGDEGDEFDSLADIIANGDKLTEIPQSSTPIKADSSGGASAVIPIAAGLSAAAAAGIGAKVFMDKKNNAENGEDDEFDTDDWSEDGQIEIDYDESEGSIADQYLNDEDDYGYQADTGERYGARSSEELADLQ